jgi:putative ABC transport system ATP-binding protein
MPTPAAVQAPAATPATPSLVEMRDVVKAFATPAGEFLALRGVNLDIPAGQFVAIIGKSGSGKSTLLNMVTGIDKPTRGTVVVAGTAVHALSENRTARWRGLTVGVVFQFFQLMPTLSVLDNIMLPMDFCDRFPARERRGRALAMLERVELADQAHKLPSELSGGQQQRAAIARAMANEPPILAADEPTGNLDSRTADRVFGLFEEMARNGKTVIMVTHDRDLASRVGRAVMVADGNIVEDLLNARGAGGAGGTP